VHKEEIAALVAKRARGAKAGDQTYMSSFQGSVTEFMESLEDPQISELKKIKSEWNNESHPVDFQRKTADRIARSTLQASAESLFKDMGLRVLVWEFHKN
jgi:hypothetical protein